MYYKAPSGKAGDMTKFDIHPKGVLPLGKTKVERVEPKTKPPPGYIAFMVSHPSFIKGNLIAACHSEAELTSWFQVMSNASKVTYKNAMEGDNQITELREQGSKKLKEKKSYAKKAKEDAAMVETLKTKRSVADVKLGELKKAENQRTAAMAIVKEQEEVARLERESVEEEILKVQSKKLLLETERVGLETKASTARLEAEQVTKKLQKSRSKAQIALEEAELAASTLAEEEKKLRAKTKQRDNEVQKAMKERDRLLSQIEKEKKDRMEMEEQLRVASTSLYNLDQMLRRKKLGDLGIDVDIKNIRNMFENGGGNNSARGSGGMGRKAAVGGFEHAFWKCRKLRTPGVGCALVRCIDTFLFLSFL